MGSLAGHTGMWLHSTSLPCPGRPCLPSAGQGSFRFCHQACWQAQELRSVQQGGRPMHRLEGDWQPAQPERGPGILATAQHVYRVGTSTEYMQGVGPEHATWSLESNLV